jgi:signal transduction histidine kinase/ActR/RegA family two-component response regulator
MQARFQNFLIPQSFISGSFESRRTSIMKYFLLIEALSSIPFYFISHPDYDRAWHVLGMSGQWLLFFLLLKGFSYRWVAHANIFWSISYVAGIALLTGGINSPIMVWITGATLPAVVLLSRSALLGWLFVAIATNLLLFLLGQHGSVSSAVNMQNDAMGWNITSRLLVTSVILYVIHVTERLHRVQVDEMDQSNDALEQTQLELLRVQAHKDEFIASVGHEFRTPMSAILGFNGLLRQQVAANPEDVKVVDLIRTSTEQLLHVVNDILDFSQLQAGKLVLQEESFALKESLAALVAKNEGKAMAKGLSLHLEATAVHNLWVKGDKQRLEQVLNNLLDNALKFTAAGSITLRVQPVGGGVLFEVQDTGIGIASEKQQKIFNRFEHADEQTNRKFGGAGLGLSICERLVTLQGGTIGVNSTLGHGARFWFQLPLRSVAVQEAKTAAEIVRELAARPLRLLMVDDNAVNLMVARLMLQKLFPSATLVEAQSGAEALEKVKFQRFDLILMDVVMPDMDGMQVTQHIRQSLTPPASDMPVLALTASTNPVDHERCLASGMNDVVHKPLDESQLISKISNALTLHAVRSAP